MLIALALLVTMTCTPDAPCRERITEIQNWSQSELNLVELINDYREDLGLPEFTINQDLKIESDKRAQVLSYLPAVTHEGVENAFVVLSDKCYEGLTEILGGGYTTIETVLAAWKKSAGHNRALMNSKNIYIGVTNTVGQNGQTIYVILFAR